jgi:hypothetical protein
MSELDKPEGKGQGSYAEKGDEKLQSERLDDLEARVTALEIAAAQPV